ncbi:MAG: TetM/TetW/TetO/TetS family tetracycline resistance ribosomal protection protein [Ruminococcus sp.]|nr:TetM/TetW/TetO/TetS family tetracycline resistance ribosomal protection protein [Ruminococcus sp.]
MDRMVIGLTAHVDAGKTTLAEALLYECGGVRTAGRVDKGTAFLDNFEVERRRGITVFSKQAVISWGDRSYTLLDTPGHADFSAETERALSVMDFGIMVINGAEGVQSHTETLWRLFARYNIPLFLFVNKMDISPYGREEIMDMIKGRLSDRAADFSPSRDGGELTEDISAADERIMNEYLESGSISDEAIRDAVGKRLIFPCCFGAALKHKGIGEFLEVLGRYAEAPEYGGGFGGIVYKITREKGVRLAHIKVTGGSLRVRDEIFPGEKVGRIRVYSGEKYSCPEEVFGGQVCAVEGLPSAYAGQRIGEGNCGGEMSPVLEAALYYKVLPISTDEHTVLERLRSLEEEDPSLKVSYKKDINEIGVRLMGDIQPEILKGVYKDRFGEEIEFGEGSVAYKETVDGDVYGVGHYEPLRHYAEVHVKISPAERGSGVVYESVCPEDILERHWQRLILSALESKEHSGTLTGSPLTDVKITLIKGRAHLKHTEGGDFRQVALRAVRMALMGARMRLLEPWYEFRISVPRECVGRAMTDLERMGAEISAPENMGETAVIQGRGAVSKMRNYQREAAAYSGGRAKVSLVFGGYGDAAEAESVITAIGYDPESDLDNPADSVFCSHGAGVNVPWKEAAGRMHMEIEKADISGCDNGGIYRENVSVMSSERSVSFGERLYSDKELMEVFERTYGKIKRDPRQGVRRDKKAEETSYPKRMKSPVYKGKEYLLVDGYNIIFAWDELNKMAADSLDLARGRLVDILCNYQGYKQNNVIVVFDAYKVKGNHRETEQVCGVKVVYTKEAETADMYIEKASGELAREHKVRVATSDGAEQMIILGSGALRVTAGEFEEEVKGVEKAIGEEIARLEIGSNAATVVKVSQGQ